MTETAPGAPQAPEKTREAPPAVGGTATATEPPAAPETPEKETPEKPPASSAASDDGGPTTYGGQNRPLGFGSVPSGHSGFGEHPNFRHGTVTYPKALSDEDARSYQLTRIAPEGEHGALADKVADGMKEYASEYVELGQDDPKAYQQGIRQHVERHLHETNTHADVEALAGEVQKRIEAHAAGGAKTAPAGAAPLSAEEPVTVRPRTPATGEHPIPPPPESEKPAAATGEWAADKPGDRERRDFAKLIERHTAPHSLRRVDAAALQEALASGDTAKLAEAMRALPETAAVGPLSQALRSIQSSERIAEGARRAAGGPGAPTAAPEQPARTNPDEVTGDEQAQRQAAAEESARRRRKPGEPEGPGREPAAEEAPAAPAPPAAETGSQAPTVQEPPPAEAPKPSAPAPQAESPTVQQPQKEQASPSSQEQKAPEALPEPAPARRTGNEEERQGNLAPQRVSDLEASEGTPEEVWAHIEHVVARGSDRFETLHRHKDGHLLEVEVATTYWKEAEQFFVFIRDIGERKRLIRELQGEQEQLLEAQKLGEFGNWELELVTGKLGWSQEIYAIFEIDPARFPASYEAFLNAIHPEDREKVNKAYSDSLVDRQPYHITHRLLMSDGRVKWVEERCSSTFDEAGKPLRSLGTVQDVTQRETLAEELRIAAVAFETQEAILVTDRNANIVKVNQAFEEITGYKSEEVLGRNPRLLRSGRHDRAFYEAMWNAILHDGRWSGEVWDRRRDGGVYPKWLTITAVTNADEVTHYVAVFIDITERKKAEEEIRNLAFYDPLTGLPNRRLMQERMHLALGMSTRSAHYGALMFLDLDNFKVLNDTKGHEYGDMMLVEVARRLEACVRETDSLARFGGDEFVVLLEGLSADQDAAITQAGGVAEKIRDALSRPYQLRDIEHLGSPSIGVVLFKGEDKAIEELFKQADLAMYQAKESGRNLVRFFEPSMQAVLESRTLGGSVFGVGKYLSPKLYVSYGVSMIGSGSAVTLKYLLRRGFDIEIESSTIENRASLNWRLER